MTKVGNNGELLTKSQSVSDNILIDKVKNGDKEAFSELVRRYQDKIFNAAYRLSGNWHNASDVVQKTFILAYQNIVGFKGESTFSTWLFRIAFNQGISFKREQASHRVISFYSDNDGNSMDINEPASSDNSPTESMEMNEKQKIIRNGISELNEDDRKVIILKDIEGNSYKEIAEILGINVVTVRTRLHRARLRLKEKIRIIIEIP